MHHVLDPITYVDSVIKGLKILWNNKLEVYFKEIKYMASSKTMLNFLDWTIIFAVHTNASDKQLSDVISKITSPFSSYLVD